MANSRNFLEQISGEYLTPSINLSVDQRLMMLVADHVIRNLPSVEGRVLELGVGLQVWTPMLLAKYSDVTTVDGAASLLDRMKNQLAGLECALRWHSVPSMFEDFTPATPFDLVLATYVLEHVDNAKAVIERARKHWLTRGGLLAVAVPQATSLHRRLAVHMGLAQHPAELGDSDRRLGHKHCFTHTQMETLLIDAGFRIRERQGMLTKALPNALLANCDDRQLKGLFDLGLELPIDYAAAIYFLAEAV
ncbi:MULTISPECIES: methyltransferase domain-containing protein [unclassified Bradyrhizobium]|uniref:class I SAM-dependent methyltransferase n=1 Tax=unclassified Bradyrhizobium TaxID=2631580 RepID=UPI001FF9DB66|nr:MULTISPECIES: methyltransferase domain-containing protein [unclassified Bradyrhizobium]MCK1313540.1 methyltransferase domain-containing protein [Bradyrhizobium sp. 23]MCK1450481.1 methyltransferase domain-containing protein [Bradyrhizobium sp. 35]MCK1507592.1 methyltransferase domain-containing protein [Bradyrhizobium sp. 18]